MLEAGSLRKEELNEAIKYENEVYESERRTSNILRGFVAVVLVAQMLMLGYNFKG